MDIFSYIYLWLAWEKKIITQHQQASMNRGIDSRCLETLRLLEREHKSQYIDASIFEIIKEIITHHKIQTLNCYKLVWAIVELAVSHTPEYSLFKIIHYKRGKKPKDLLDLATFIKTVKKIETVQLPIPSILKKALQNSPAEIQIGSAFVLAKINQPIAINTLLKFAQDSTQNLAQRQAVIDLIKSYNKPQVTSFFKQLIQNKNEVTQFRITALSYLKSIPDPEINNIIKKIALDEQEPTELRLVALKILQTVDNPKILNFLKQIIQDKQQYLELRQAAVKIIGHFKDLKVINILQDIIQNTTESQYLRITAIQTLGNFSDLQVINFLREIIYNQNEDIKFRLAAIQALGQRKIYRNNLILQKIVKDKTKDIELRQVALSELTGVALSILEKPEYEVYRGHSLGFEELEETEPALTPPINPASNTIEDDQTIRLLQKISRDLNEIQALRKIAIVALSKVKISQETTNILIQIAQDSRESRVLQHTAIESIVEIRTPQAIQFLKYFFNNIETKLKSSDDIFFFSQILQKLTLEVPESWILILIKFWKLDIAYSSELVTSETSTQQLDSKKFSPRILEYKSYVNTFAKIGKSAEPVLDQSIKPNDSETFKQFIQLTLKIIDQDLDGYYNELCRPQPRAHIGWWFQEMGSFFGSSNYF